MNVKNTEHKILQKIGFAILCSKKKKGINAIVLCEFC